MKILYFVSEDWFFLSHFLPVARVARNAGFDVVVATRVRDGGDRIAAEGFQVIPYEVERHSTSVVKFLSALVRAYRIVRAEKPDVAHCIALQMIVLCGPAAKLAGTHNLVMAFTGLGYVWSSGAFAGRLWRLLVRGVVRWLHGSGTTFLFENTNDPKELGLDRIGADVAIVPGSGVDPKDFPPSPEPPFPPVKIAIVSRITRKKGVADAVEAVRLARRAGADVELGIYGAPDPADSEPIAETTLRQWSSEPGIAWHGHTSDVARVWREHHIALFLSYREGAPRTLIEAAASARPVVATDVVGCRDIVRDGVEGLLVPPGDAEAASRAILKLAGDAELRGRLGRNAHQRFQERFTEEAVRDAVRRVYARIAERPSSSAG